MHVLGLQRGSKDELPRGLRHFVGRPRFCPVVATGDNEPLGVTVLRALGVKWQSNRHRPTTEEVLQAVRHGIAKARHQNYAGLLFILDFKFRKPTNRELVIIVAVVAVAVLLVLFYNEGWWKFNYLYKLSMERGGNL